MKEQEARELFAQEINDALLVGMNYAEVGNDSTIHFCRVENNSTPVGWSWGPDCLQFWA